MRNNRGSAPRARKSLGQHFLRDSGVLADIAEAAAPPPGGIVVEVGAGTGELTAALVARYPNVIAIEIEDRLVRYLEKRFALHSGLRIVEGDARDIDLGQIIPHGRFSTGKLNDATGNGAVVAKRLAVASRPAVANHFSNAASSPGSTSYVCAKNACAAPA